MPCRYVIDTQRRLILSKGWGRVTFAEIKALQEQMLNDPAFDPQFDQLSDGTSVTAMELSIYEIRLIANRKVLSDTSRRAFVAPNPAVFGVGRMMEAFNTMSDTSSLSGVFHDLRSALKFLGIESLPDLILEDSKGPAAHDSAGNGIG